jgi:hypothetical protein
MKALMGVLILLLTCIVHADQVDVYDDDISAGDIVEWKASDTIFLHGHVWVEDGAELHIEPGTLIWGDQGTGSNTAVLVICKGAKIFAEGNASSPIIFTSVTDLGDWLGDSEEDGTGLWGGVVIMGDAPTNRGETHFEAFDIEESRNTFGGENEEDNSGIFTYVSIRYGGMTLKPEKEINGLTLCGVGRGTTIHHVEVFQNSDDGFEWFGGTVNTKYLIAFNCGDDAFDYDYGYRGFNQFWFGSAVKHGGGTRLGEHSSGDGRALYSRVHVTNATYIGEGNFTGALYIDQGAAAQYTNSIFFETSDIDFNDPASKQHLETGESYIKNCIFDKPGVSEFGWDWNDFNMPNDIIPHLEENNNHIDTALIFEGERKGGANFASGDELLWTQIATRNQMADIRPTSQIALSDMYPVWDRVETMPESFFSIACFKGAFDPAKDTLWIDGWTAASQFGFTTSSRSAAIENVPDCAGTAISQNDRDRSNALAGAVEMRKGRIVFRDFPDMPTTISISLYNLRGKLVQKFQNISLIRDKFEHSSLSSIAKGHYLIKIQGRGLQRCKRVVTVTMGR